MGQHRSEVPGPGRDFPAAASLARGAGSGGTFSLTSRAVVSLIPVTRCQSPRRKGPISLLVLSTASPCALTCPLTWLSFLSLMACDLGCLGCDGAFPKSSFTRPKKRKNVRVVVRVGPRRFHQAHPSHLFLCIGIGTSTSRKRKGKGRGGSSSGEGRSSKTARTSATDAASSSRTGGEELKDKDARAHGRAMKMGAERHRNRPTTFLTAQQEKEAVARFEEQNRQLVSRIVHCLNSPMRQWTRYEWFYPGIDRGYFAHNEFQAVLEDPSVRLGAVPLPLPARHSSALICSSSSCSSATLLSTPAPSHCHLTPVTWLPRSLVLFLPHPFLILFSLRLAPCAFRVPCALPRTCPKVDTVRVECGEVVHGPPSPSLLVLSQGRAR